MHLQLDNEQSILRDTVSRFVAEHYDYRTYRAIAESESGWSQELWRNFAEMGWLGLPFSPDDGGYGGGATEIAILMEAVGHSLVLEPYLSTTVLSGGIVTALASASDRQRLLAPVIAGEVLMAFAHRDGGVPTAANPVADGYVLDGRKTMVLGAPMADTLLVSAALRGGALGVFEVPKRAAGISVHPFRLLNGQRAADVTLSGVRVPENALLSRGNDTEAKIAAVIDRTIVALAADAVGAISALVSATVEYAKTRVQFGQTISKFQAVQHRLVAMKIREEEARAAALFATLSLDGEAEHRARAVAGAKAKIGRAARFVYQNAIQLHGAIGTTEELAVGAYAKRLMAFETLFGTTRAHLQSYGAIIADPALAASDLLGIGRA